MSRGNIPAILRMDVKAKSDLLPCTVEIWVRMPHGRARLVEKSQSRPGKIGSKKWTLAMDHSHMSMEASLHSEAIGN